MSETHQGAFLNNSTLSEFEYPGTRRTRGSPLATTTTGLTRTCFSGGSGGGGVQLALGERPAGGHGRAAAVRWLTATSGRPHASAAAAVVCAGAAEAQKPPQVFVQRAVCVHWVNRFSARGPLPKGSRTTRAGRASHHRRDSAAHGRPPATQSDSRRARRGGISGAAAAISALNGRRRRWAGRLPIAPRTTSASCRAADAWCRSQSQLRPEPEPTGP